MSGAIKWDCYEIDHDGDGSRGRHCIVYQRFLLTSDEDAAKEAASAFDEQEVGEQGLDAQDLDNTSRVVEVAPTVMRWNAPLAQTAPVRFRVWCRVKREYEARGV